MDTSTERWLDEIEERTDYKAWLCGHWHCDKHIDKLHFLFHDFVVAKNLRRELAKKAWEEK